MTTLPRRRRSARVNKNLPRMLAATVERQDKQLLHHEGGGFPGTTLSFPSRQAKRRQTTSPHQAPSKSPYRQAGREKATPPSPPQSGKTPMDPAFKKRVRAEMPRCQRAKSQWREEEGPRDELRAALQEKGLIGMMGLPVGNSLVAKGVVFPSTRIQFKGCLGVLGQGIGRDLWLKLIP